MSIEQITRLLVSPKRPIKVDNLNWDRIEDRFGIILPGDFKRFTEVYGTGSIGDFLWILNPFSPNRHLNFEASLFARNTYYELRDSFQDIFLRPKFPKEGSFFPLAVTDKGDTCCWVLNGSHDFEHCIQSRDQDEEILAGKGFAEFMIGVLSGQIGSSILPSDFLTKEKKFESKF